MANILENYGIDFLAEDEKTLMGFVGYLTENGKVVHGYHSDAFYIYKAVGSAEFWVRVKKDFEGNWSVEGIDSHCQGRCVWEMSPTDIDITPKNSSKLKRILMFNNANGNGGLIPIEIVNSDVLPGFNSNNMIKMQVVALPIEINYYADEKEYENAQPDSDNGKKWLISNGSMMAIPFLCNHTSDEYDKNKEYESDKYIYFCATVKALYNGKFTVGEETENTFIRCVAETMFGDVEFDHTIDQVSKEQIENIKIGAVISGVCILSADVAIYEYTDGFVKDFDNDLKLLSDVFANGDSDRLESVLLENSTLTTCSSNTEYIGISNIIERFKTVYQNCDAKCFSHIAKISSYDGEKSTYEIGTRCIVLAYEEETNYEAIAFITVNNDGMITKIDISSDSKYHFNIEKSDDPHPLFDSIEVPDSVVVSIVSRAQFHNLISIDTEPSTLIENISEYDMFEQNAYRMLEALKDDPQSNAVETIKNIIGYLFAKSIEYKFNIYHRERNTNWLLAASYCPADAFAGTISSRLDNDEHKILVESIELGRQFGKDIFVFMQMKGLTDEHFEETFTRAAITVQRIGEIYAEKILKDKYES